MIYFPDNWHFWRVIDWLIDHDLVHGAFNLKQTAFNRGLTSVWGRPGHLIWAFELSEHHGTV